MTAPCGCVVTGLGTWTEPFRPVLCDECYETATDLRAVQKALLLAAIAKATGGSREN